MFRLFLTQVKFRLEFLRQSNFSFKFVCFQIRSAADFNWKITWKDFLSFSFQCNLNNFGWFCQLFCSVFGVEGNELLSTSTRENESKIKKKVLYAKIFLRVRNLMLNYWRSLFMLAAVTLSELWKFVRKKQTIRPHKSFTIQLSDLILVGSFFSSLSLKKFIFSSNFETASKIHLVKTIKTFPISLRVVPQKRKFA